MKCERESCIGYGKNGVGFLINFNREIPRIGFRINYYLGVISLNIYLFHTRFLGFAWLIGKSKMKEV